MSTIERVTDPLATFGDLGRPRERLLRDGGYNCIPAPHTFDEGEQWHEFSKRQPVEPQLPVGWKSGEVKMAAKDVSASVVNGMTAGAQWAYNCNKSTRGAVKRPKTVKQTARKTARIVAMPEPSTPLEAVTAAAREYQQALRRAESARLEMNRAIRECPESTRKIADAAGVSFQRVHQIVKST